MLDFPRPKRPSLTVDLAPLIDVVFLLLVFFILTSSFRPPSLPLELPGVANTSLAPVEPITVSLDATGRIAVNGHEVSEMEFGPYLAQALAGEESRAVHFRGDRAVAYGRFLQLMQAARAAGAVRLHLVHQIE